jgi:hypothetical protein
VRLYLPATLDELTSATDVLSPRGGHALTPALAATVPDEDEEGLELIAQLAAADDSLALLAAQPAAPRLRVVVAADLPGSAVGGPRDDQGPPSAVQSLVGVRVSEIACLLVDEPAASGDVVGALAGSPTARDGLDQRDLLWYDVSEVGRVPRQ